jgi:O-antigen biosynthesis protein
MRICLVSNEILGAHRNGGIGTATSNLALLLAVNGHSVLQFYVGHTPLDTRDPWAAYYKAANVGVMHFPGSRARISPFWMKQSVEIYEQLRGQNFDLIIFQDWMALGHACMVAKRTGLAFDRTVLAVITHSSTAWMLEANRSFPQTPEHLALMHMERQAIELSDAVVSPSRYLVEWMKQAEWKLPDRTNVIPLFLEGAELLGAKLLPATTIRRRIENPSHLVFFGRFEERKGINIFLSALASEELRPFRFKLTFLGRPATRSSEDIIALLTEHRPDLLVDLDIKPNLSSDEAQSFLSQTDCIPVIPSLIDNSPCVIYEALKLGLPFVAAASGGIPELINAEDREQFLFAPTKSALARKLQEVLSSNSWGVPRPAYSQHDVGQRWLRWVEDAPEKLPITRPYVSNGAVDVTVVITHFERPRLAEQNLRALGMQTDRRFNVVLVDDGSKSEAALAFLDRAARGIAGISIKVVRQSNKYLGAARNAGLRHAETPFVIFLDDDNIAFPNMIEVFRGAAYASGADIVTCQMQFFHEATAEPDPQELICGERWAYPGGPMALGVLENCFGDATAIYKRGLFEHVGCFHEIMGVTYEDWQLHLRACLEGLSLLSLPIPLFWYRVTPGSMIRSTNPYENMRVVASALHAKVPRNFAAAIDFMIGAHSRAPHAQDLIGTPKASTLAHLYPEDARDRLVHVAHSRVIQSIIRILLALRFDHAIRLLAMFKRRNRASLPSKKGA